MSVGRSTEARTQVIGTTNASAAITGAAGTFNEEDAGRPISGTGIPAATTILSVTTDIAATLSANATATGSPTATFGVGAGTALGYGFTGWSPESDAESETYSIAGGASASAPDRLANAYTGVSQRSRG
jgi:hypothetical protein